MKCILMRHAMQGWDKYDTLEEVAQQGATNSNHPNAGQFNKIIQKVKEISPEEFSILTSEEYLAKLTGRILAQELGYVGRIEEDPLLEYEIRDKNLRFSEKDNSLRLIVSHEPPLKRFFLDNCGIDLWRMGIYNADAHMIELEPVRYIGKITE